MRIYGYLNDKPDLASNQAVCFNCGNVLTSNNQYDLLICSCGATAVDGGGHLIIELKEIPPALVEYHLRLILHLHRSLRFNNDNLFMKPRVILVEYKRRLLKYHL